MYTTYGKHDFYTSSIMPTSKPAGDVLHWLALFLSWLYFLNEMEASSL